MNWLSLTCVALVCMVACSCSTVLVEDPVGKPVTEKNLGNEADGIWAVSDDQAYHVHHLGNGIFKVAIVGWNTEKGAFEIGQGRAVLTEIGDDRYFQIEQIESDETKKNASEKSPYILLKAMGPERDLMVLHAPNTKRFAAHVEDKTIKGSVKERSNVHISGNGGVALEEILRSGPSHELFNLEKPIVIQRINKKQ